MHKNAILFVIIAALGGFIGGFLLANSINRSQLAVVRDQVPSSGAPATNNSSEGKDTELSASEIRAKIDEADKKPNDFDYQKNLGGALYKYAAMKQDPGLLTEAARILERAGSLKTGDLDVLILLGNAKFDIAYANKNNAGFASAREIYTKALELKPGDPDISTDRALTYFFLEPPDYEKARAELQKVIDANPKHERSMQFLIKVLVNQKKITEAERAWAKLKEINPQNRSLPDLQAEISEAQTASK